MTADAYLRRVIAQYAVDTGTTSAVWAVRRALLPLLRAWGGNLLLRVDPSGSFAKGTAVTTGTDIDLFLSLSSSTEASLAAIHDTLEAALRAKRLTPQRRNVAIGVRVGGIDVDLVPGRRIDQQSNNQSLYVRRGDTWQKTNVARHIQTVRGSKRINEIRAIKIWRNRIGLDFPSFYLELAVIRALTGRQTGKLADNVVKVFVFLRDELAGARIVDPANTANIISNELIASEKKTVANAAAQALSSKWEDVIV